MLLLILGTLFGTVGLWAIYMEFSGKHAARQKPSPVAWLENLHQAPRWWGYGGALWRGWVRSDMVALVTGPILGFGVACGQIDKQPFQLISTVFAWTFAASILLMLSIVLFNRPAWAVRREYRSHPGAIREWEGASPPERPTSE